MEGWVGLVGWPIADALPTKWSHVNHGSGVDQGKSASYKPTFLPLSHAANVDVWTVKMQYLIAVNVICGKLHYEHYWIVDRFRVSFRFLFSVQIYYKFSVIKNFLSASRPLCDLTEHELVCWRIVLLAKLIGQIITILDQESIS